MTSMRHSPYCEEPTVFAGSVSLDRGMRASSPIEYKALTPEQTAALSGYRARWAAIRRSTEPADRGAAEEGVRLAYHAAGFKPPARLVWCESPVALSHLTCRASCADGPNLKSAVIDRLRRQVASLVGRRVDKCVQAVVESAVSPTDALVASAADAVVQGAAHVNASLLERVRRGRSLSSPWNLRALLGRQGFRDGAAGQHDLSVACNLRLCLQRARPNGRDQAAAWSVANGDKPWLGTAT